MSRDVTLLRYTARSCVACTRVSLLLRETRVRACVCVERELEKRGTKDCKQLTCNTPSFCLLQVFSGVARAFVRARACVYCRLCMYL